VLRTTSKVVYGGAGAARRKRPTYVGCVGIEAGFTRKDTASPRHVLGDAIENLTLAILGAGCINTAARFATLRTCRQGSARSNVGDVMSPD
jgi:hypothetical protein